VAGGHSATLGRLVAELSAVCEGDTVVPGAGVDARGTKLVRVLVDRDAAVSPQLARGGETDG
jgi:hypothetical protein